ncbi:MAG: N-acetylmuramic acid 6-phosphate etherase [Planctomycetes bacterium]|nr:N-acetylmuramic acid 6-phosphate etherase [Planctomycetota bacterium]
MTLPPDTPATESRSGVPLDLMSPLELAAAFAREDARAVAAVAAAGPQVARAIELARDAILDAGRVILGGAGTSGRLAVMEAAECLPTFSTSMVVGLIAGGPAALLAPQEGAEDDRDAGFQALERLGPSRRDLVLGVAASGRTPWVLGLLESAGRHGARRGLVACAAPPPDLRLDVALLLETGPELLSGSTRLKAATATKCALNAITTGAMAILGRVMDDLMVSIRPTNAKLRARARRIVAALTPCDAERAAALLEAAGWEVDTAILIGRRGGDAAAARERLRMHAGHLRRALEGPG